MLKPKKKVQLDVPTKSLFRWNVAMALFHGALIGATVYLGSLDLKVPVYGARLDLVIGHLNSTDGWQLVPAQPKRQWWLYYTAATIAVYSCSAIAHTGAAFLWRESYYSNLRVAMSPYRWAEYAASATIMVVLIAYLCGVVETFPLIGIAALTATTMVHGHLHELICRPQTPQRWAIKSAWVRLQGHFAGYLPYLAAWGLVLYRFFELAGRSTTDADGKTRSMPDFVYAIVFGEVVVFSSFAVVQVVTSLRAPAQYYQGEIAYMWLSLLSKGFLGIMLLSNVLMLDEFSEIYE